MQRHLAIAVLLLAGTFSAPAVAQDDPAASLEDFIHYTLIAKPDLASAFGQALIESGVTDADLARLVDEGSIATDRFDHAIQRAYRVPELEDIAADLARRVEQGRLDLAREPGRIDEAIAMLGGEQRARLLAKRRLEAAGEYAVPALLRVITEGRDEKLRVASRDMLVTIGRVAVMPLCEAVTEVDEGSQRIIADVLGEIGYLHAAPALKALVDNAATGGPTREAAARSLDRIGGGNASLSELHTELAIQYYRPIESLIAYPYEDTNNVWSYDAFVGLQATPVPTVVFNEIMAMREASRAVALDAGNARALTYFVAANLKRENDLPAGAADPIYGNAKYSPDFYATIFGTQVCQDVLALALDTADTPLVRDAIAALADTTGGSNLFSASGGRQPLLDAVLFSDRRVQYDAGLTLAHALPDRSFEGDFRVVPLLASAVRTGNQSFAMVVAGDEENRRQAVNSLESLGYSVVGAEATVGDLSLAIADAVGVDLVVVRVDDGAAAEAAVSELRSISKTVAAPVLVLAAAVDVPGLERTYRDDGRVRIARPGISDVAFDAVIEELLASATGGRMTEAEAEEYTFRALGALKEIAISNSPAYTIDDAEIALIDAMRQRSGGVRLVIADILARIGTDLAQNVLFEAALSASGGEQVDLLARVADSVKRFGNRAENRHVAGLVNVIRTRPGAVAEAAADVYGAMNLPSADVIGMID